jgi:hypothetical protein
MLLSSKSPAAAKAAAAAAVASTVLQHHPHLPETHSPFTFCFLLMGCKPVHAAKIPILIPIHCSWLCVSSTVFGAQNCRDQENEGSREEPTVITDGKKRDKKMYLRACRVVRKLLTKGVDLKQNTPRSAVRQRFAFRYCEVKGMSC